MATLHIDPIGEDPTATVDAIWDALVAVGVNPQIEDAGRDTVSIRFDYDPLNGTLSTILRVIKAMDINGDIGFDDVNISHRAGQWAK